MLGQHLFIFTQNSAKDTACQFLYRLGLRNLAMILKLFYLYLDFMPMFEVRGGIYLTHDYHDYNKMTFQ